MQFKFYPEIFLFKLAKIKKELRACFLLAVIICLLISCSKSKQNSNSSIETTRNGVNISIAIATFNSYRTSGFKTLPSVPALKWNDTLSDAAFKFAKDIAMLGDGSSIYMTSRGNFILDYPNTMGYRESAFLGFCYQFPDNANVKDMIDQGFNAYPENSNFTNMVMAAGTTKLGMGEYNNRWYLIAGN